MGCTFAHPRNGDADPRIFKVLNVDSEGQERNPGKIEITESELILHQKGKSPIRWPLRSLRRYGFDAELFSFESGRRCPTGEGIYAFQCQRAEALFNLLQECIQRAGQDDPAVPPVNLNQAAALHVDNRPVLHTNTLENNTPFRPIQPAVSTNPSLSRSMSQHADGVVSLQVFPSVPSAHEYINTDSLPEPTPVDMSAVTLRLNSVASRRASSNGGGSINNGAEPRIQYAQLDLQRTSMDAHLSPSSVDSESSQAMYINFPAAADTVATGNKHLINSNAIAAAAGATSTSNTTNNKKIGPPMLKLSTSPAVVEEQQHEYLNLNLDHNGKAKKCPPPLPSYSRQTTVELEPPSEPKITYIEVDFKNNEDGTTANGGSRVTNGEATNVAIGALGRSASHNGDTLGPLKTDSYAVIDFNKTAAINAKNTNAKDEGVRKTRHNSSIEELQ